MLEQDESASRAYLPALQKGESGVDVRGAAACQNQREPRRARRDEAADQAALSIRSVSFAAIAASMPAPRFAT